MVKVLVVDDNPFNLDILNEYMNEEGFDTVLAEHALSALKYLDENPDSVDIILLDRMMPHMDGIEMLENLKSDDRFADIPIVMVTAAADQKAVYEGNKSGVDAYITKPFERDILLEAINKALFKAGKNLKAS